PWARPITAYAIALGVKFFRDKPDAQGGPPCAFFIAEKRKTDNRHQNIPIGHNHTLCIVSPR
ncbi:hypothetical protein, partial [Citrobacter freundii]|uniref:hypothetical protein n=1 Tax=Citrobacter freundii TaxID=546 RepID=UPI001C69C46F